jgi:Inner membrane component of T3SS, cytoplasmic domain
MKLRIQQGRRRGREYSVGRTPVTIGRAAQCDIVIPDDQLVSSEHADVHVDSNGQLLLRDLESVNGTEVNGQSVQEAVLKPGDEIAIGSTVFEVIEEAASPGPAATPERGFSTDVVPVPPEETRVAEKTVDRREEAGEVPAELTFGKKPARTAPKPASPMSKRLLSLGLTAAIVLVVIGGLIFVLSQIGVLNLSRGIAQGITLTGDFHRVDIFYEKVQASTQNIFRFALRISGDRVTLNVDDLKQHRHIQREKKIGETLLADLVRQMERGGFDNLERPKYGGLPADQQEMAVIELTRGTRVKRVEIENTIAPDAYVNAQKVLEDFAQNELGMAAINRSREELIKEADEAFLRANQLFEQRDVDFPNLYNAIKAYQLVQVDLEAIEPKPANFTVAVKNEDTAKKMLEERINNLRFNAEQAMKLADWPRAQACLSEIMARVPDREDERYREADRKLISVQGHMPRR